MTYSLSRIFSALLVIVLCGVITSAFSFQLTMHELPCPLCFLQRLAMIGVCVGQLLNFRFGIKPSHHAISLFHCIFGSAVALRQIALHICPTFTRYGTPLLGFSLYTWSFIVFFCAMVTIGVLLFLYEPKWRIVESKPIQNLERFAFIYTLVIVIANIITAFYICGLMPCPDNP